MNSRLQPLEPEACHEASNCKNSIQYKGQWAAACISCRLAPGNEGLQNQHWRPREPNLKHSVLEGEKRKARIDRAIANREKRQNIDPRRRKVSRIAEKAERATEASIIEATKNSGRSNRDGDHLIAGNITMDTKLQSTRLDPTVNLHELFKVQKDAQRAGSLLGCLTIRNRHGVGVVVLAEEDFARLVAQIKQGRDEHLNEL
jgi:hypothetical protein